MNKKKLQSLDVSYKNSLALKWKTLEFKSNAFQKCFIFKISKEREFFSTSISFT